MTLPVDRRRLIRWIGAAPFLFGARRVLAQDFAGEGGQALIESDLSRFIGLGVKASGGVGDTASGQWFEAELVRAGFELERVTFQVPCFEGTKVALSSGGHEAALIPQAVVTQTGTEGVEGQLFRLDPKAAGEIPGGAIVIVDLPKQGWSTVTSPLILEALKRCERAGAVGVVLLTNGPTDQAIALNAHEDHPVSQLPVACLAPRDAAPFLELAARKARGRLTIQGKAGTREAFNVAGHRRVPGSKRTIIVSTPRSGWFGCAAERGPGVALWLDLVRWVARERLPVNLIFSAHSGHEYENLGLRSQLPHMAAPSDVPLWLGFGAGTATRAARGLGDGATAGATETGETQVRRLLTVTDQTEVWARDTFAGWGDTPDPFFTRGGGASEAGTAIAAGYGGVIGFNGTNPYHHVQGDLGENIDPALVSRLSIACQELISRVAKA